MSKKIRMELSKSSIDRAIKELKQYEGWIAQKEKQLLARLAQIGVTGVRLGYASVDYDGTSDVQVQVEPSGNGYAVVARGEAIAFLEFGAGIRFGGGHPKPQVDGQAMGPGTYPSDKGHWDDPKGWWIPAENGGGHTYGNAPSAAMYETAKYLREYLLPIAREVFGSG